MVAAATSNIHFAICFLSNAYDEIGIGIFASY